MSDVKDKVCVDDVELVEMPAKHASVDSFELSSRKICPICFESYSDENPVMFAPCGHPFHFSCLVAWYQRSNTCPICFHEFSLFEEDEEEVVWEQPVAPSHNVAETVVALVPPPGQSPEPSAPPSFIANDISEVHLLPIRMENERSEKPKSFWRKFCACCFN